MKILYIDLDSQRPDHLGCYGYHRDTSPNIDAIAAKGLRFNNCHVTDAPCLPSRTALITGQFGIRNGTVNHGGRRADPYPYGRERSFKARHGDYSFPMRLRYAGHHTGSVSSFAERHSALQFTCGFNEVMNHGKSGNELAHEQFEHARWWLDRWGKTDDWFLHLNFWDAHTPYRTPPEFGDPFKDEPLPAWLTEEVRAEHWKGYGPHSAREINGWDIPKPGTWAHGWPRQPVEASDMNEVRRMFDGYDTGVRYSDEYVGRVMNHLADLGVLDEVAVVISADHGENLGELNIYGDHQTADQITTRVPLIMHWPGVTDAVAGESSDAFVHQIDYAATIVDLAGGEIPHDWDGISFADSMKQGDPKGRDYLLVSQNAWSCQRAVRWGDYICVRSYHDGYHGFPEIMLFNDKDDPHEQNDLADERPDLVGHAMRLLDEWHTERMIESEHGDDPLNTVLMEGGAFHTRDELLRYLERLRQTDRAHHAEALEKRYPQDVSRLRGE